MPSEQEAQQMIQAALDELRLFDVLCPRVFALISFLHRLDHLFLALPPIASNTAESLEPGHIASQISLRMASNEHVAQYSRETRTAASMNPASVGLLIWVPLGRA
jgi:hypothetical protein